MRYFLLLVVLILISGCDDKNTAENNVLDYKDDVAKEKLVIIGKVIGGGWGDKYYQYDIELMNIIDNPQHMSFESHIKIRQANYKNQPELNRFYKFELDYKNIEKYSEYYFYVLDFQEILDDEQTVNIIEKCFSVANKELIDNPLNNFDIDKHKLNFSVQDDCYIVYYEPIYPARLGGGCKVYINEKDFSVIKVIREK